MAKRKKKNAADVWSRRQFTLALVNTGMSVAALGASLSNKPVIVQVAAPPVQVLPQPVVARAITTLLAGGGYITVNVHDAVLSHAPSVEAIAVT
jgi:hypothetical protein